MKKADEMREKLMKINQDGQRALQKGKRQKAIKIFASSAKTLLEACNPDNETVLEMIKVNLGMAKALLARSKPTNTDLFHALNSVLVAETSRKGTFPFGKKMEKEIGEAINMINAKAKKIKQAGIKPGTFYD